MLSTLKISSLNSCSLNSKIEHFHSAQNFYASFLCLWTWGFDGTANPLGIYGDNKDCLNQTDTFFEERKILFHINGRYK